MKQLLVLVLSVALLCCNSKKESAKNNSSTSTAPSTSATAGSGATNGQPDQGGFAWKSFGFKPAHQQPQTAYFDQLVEMQTYLKGVQEAIDDPFVDGLTTRASAADHQKIHDSLLGLKGVNVDVIVTLHAGVGAGDSDFAHSVAYQQAAARLVQEKGYEVVIVENFDSVSSSSKVLAKLDKTTVIYQCVETMHEASLSLRQPPPSDKYVSEGVDACRKQLAPAILVENSPSISVYGGDLRAVRRAQQYLTLMSLLPEISLDARRQINQGLGTLSNVRDLNFAGQVVLLAKEHPGKRIAILVAAGHTQHLVGVMSRYGASGNVILHDGIYDTYINQCREVQVEVIEHQ